MIFRTTFLTLFFVLIGTTQSFALWLEDSCTEFKVDFDVIENSNCMTVVGDEGIDAAFNLCLEIAGFPISTLPALIEDSEKQLTQEIAPEEPESPQATIAPPSQPLAKSFITIAENFPRPKPVKNECSAFEVECERLPNYPHYQLEDVSPTPATTPRDTEDVDDAPLVQPSATVPEYSKGPRRGFSELLEEPPELG